MLYAHTAVTHNVYKCRQDIYNIQSFSEGHFKTSHLSCKGLHATLVQEAHLSCFAKALLLAQIKTKHTTPSSFFHVIQLSFLSTFFLFYFGILFTWLSCFLPASLPVHHSHPVHLSLAGGIAFARETLLCVLQHILLCSLSPLGPGAVHFLGNIPVLKRIGVILHCKHSEASDMHKHKERKQGEF